MPDGGRSTVRSRRLGATLLKYRKAAGFDQDEAAEAIKGSGTKISRMEAGKVTVRPLELVTLLRAYGVDDQEEVARLEAMSRASMRRGWWVDYGDSLSPGYGDHISLEAEATYIRSWDNVLIPGLLQTEPYAAVTISSGPVVVEPERLEEKIKLRRERQERIANEGIPQAVVLWEPAITSPMGGEDIHRGQLEHLLELSTQTNISIQVLPVGSRVMTGMGTPFTAFSFGPDLNIEAVTIEGLISTHVYEAEPDLAAYGRLFDGLRSEAASTSESQALIRRTLRSRGTTPS